MAAANTDKFKKVQRKFSTTLSSTLAQSATTAALSSTSGLPTDTAVTVTIDRVDSNGTATPSSEEVVTGVVSGSNIQNLVRGKEGTSDQAHSAGAVVEMLWTETVWNDAVDGMVAEHNQDGTHSAVTADSVVVADGGTLEVDTVNEATAANGVTIDGLNIKDSKLVTADSVVTANITDDAVTGDKLATANYQVWRESPSGTVDTTGSSFITAHSFATDMEIPTWATKVVFTWHVSSLTATSTTDGVFRLSLGTGDTTSDERVQFSTYPIGTVEHATFINEVTLSGTGTQSLTLQFREAAGSGVVRVTTSCMFHVKAEYY